MAELKDSTKRQLVNTSTLGVGIALVLAIIAEYHTLFGRDAGVALLTTMTALKVLETRTVRDAMVLVFLGYLLGVANLLYSQSVAMAAYLLLSLVVLLAAQTVVDRLLDEESANVADLEEFVGKTISFRVEPTYSQEHFDIVLL